MNKAPQPTGPPPAPSPGLPQVMRKELAETGVGVGEIRQPVRNRFQTLWIFPPPSVSGQSAVFCCQIETAGLLAVPRGCHGAGGMWTAEALAPDLLPLLHQLGFLPHPGFPSC